MTVWPSTLTPAPEFCHCGGAVHERDGDFLGRIPGEVIGVVVGVLGDRGGRHHLGAGRRAGAGLCARAPVRTARRVGLALVCLRAGSSWCRAGLRARFMAAFCCRNHCGQPRVGGVTEPFLRRKPYGQSGLERRRDRGERRHRSGGGEPLFPQSVSARRFLEDSSHSTYCPWKGEASYYSLRVDGLRNENAAWYYADPFSEAARIRDHVAFWHGVRIEA